MNNRALLVNTSIKTTSIIFNQLDSQFYIKNMTDISKATRYVELYRPKIIIVEVNGEQVETYDFITTVKREYSTNDIIVVTIINCNNSHSISDCLNSYSDACIKSPVKPLELLHTIRNLLFLKKNIQEKCYMELSKSKDLRQNKSQKEISIYTQIVHVIEKYYFNNSLKSTSIASILNTSMSTLQRKLRQNTQITIGQMIYNYRLSQSKLMLINGYSITQTALECGFSSSSHFSTKFKSKFNITPKKYISESKKRIS